MFQKIAKVNLDKGWGVELGYDVPQVITADTSLTVTTRVVQEDPAVEIDTESIEYKQAESVAEVLKIGFEVGCSYTTKVIEQTTKMGQKLMEEDPGKTTGATSDLVIDE